MKIDYDLTPAALAGPVKALFQASAAKIRSLEQSWNPSQGAPVFTVNGRYTSRGWTEWTQGFQFGSAVLQFDATGETEFLDSARRHTVNVMAPHLTHMGVHDHGFNNVSTYGGLLRLMDEGRTPENEWERRFYELALKCSGAVQAARWSDIADGGGYVYSFNGPQSLFVDTIRTIRSLGIAHRLGHVLLGENDRRISLLDRLIRHAQATARYSVYYGEGRDMYDVRGRVAHESIFNLNDGNYRCPNTQQGYSAFSTWTRGLAWAMCGFAEELEFLDTVSDDELTPHGGRDAVAAQMRRAAEATCDFYLDNAASDGIPYWDTGAPGLDAFSNWRDVPSRPVNPYEPVDSSAAVIAAQGLLRLGHKFDDRRYRQAGLTICQTLFAEPYLSADPNDQGLIRYAVYHRPNGWDGDACMWGDYHARELALYVFRLIENKPYLTFWSNSNDHR